MQISIILLCLSLAKAYGSNCNDLIGTWKNQLNSNMTIESISGKSFTGGYHTAVESTPGAATITSKVTGMIIPAESGKLIGFNVLWNRGASLTAWVGQCLECDGKEYLYTTWLLRSYLPTKKRWMTTRINQDTFWKISNEIGEQSTQDVNNNPIQNEVDGTEMQGTWTSSTGNSFKINELLGSGAWNGDHSSDGEVYGETVGRFDGNQTYTAIGFIGASDSKIKGWTGHIDEPRTPSTLLETSWLEHAFNPNCLNPRKGVSFGMDKYSKS